MRTQGMKSARFPDAGRGRTIGCKVAQNVERQAPEYLHWGALSRQSTRTANRYRLQPPIWPIILGEKNNRVPGACIRRLQLQEATMLKPFPIFCAAILIVFAATPTLGHMPQEAAPSPTGAAVKSPAKITPESQAKAKKLYGIDCEICHGANGNGKTDVGKSMELKIADWTDPASLSGKTDQELFNIIRQGKDKMPAEG